MKKKAVLGLDTAKLFVLAILILVIVSVVALIVIQSVEEIQPDAYGGALLNVDTLSVMNVTGGVYPTGLSVDSPDCALTVTAVVNESNAQTINSTNYTVTGCSIGCAGINGCDLFNNSLWTLNGTYTSSSSSKDISSNTSSALTGLFEDAGTWFTLLSVVIIILIVAVVIVVVNRFGGGSFSTGSPRVANI